MEDGQLVSFIVYALVVAGAYYHGYNHGLKVGAGRMYDYLFENAVKRGKFKFAKFKIEDNGTGKSPKV